MASNGATVKHRGYKASAANGEAHETAPTRAGPASVDMDMAGVSSHLRVDPSDHGKGTDKGGLGPARHEPVTMADLPNMALLVLLYAMQGIPLGLTLGAMPFMLQAKLSYTQLGIFSVASYPYSFKLLWSPIVDSVYSRRLGRRKTWIVPIQLASAALLVVSGGWIETRFNAGDVTALTTLFFFFVLLAATQDIAVDGWALTLLRPEHIEYASTCQTLGMNCGYFTSFTVFLALNNPEFCNLHIRAHGFFPGDPQQGIVSLGGYFTFWGWFFAVVTAALAVFKREGEVEGSQPPPPRADGAAAAADRQRGDLESPRAAGAAAAAAQGGGGGQWGEVVGAYRQLWRVVKLPSIWALSALLVTYRLGVLPAEGAASFKLMDKGVAKEALAALVLLQFPVELVSAVVAGRWASSHSPYHPFMAGFFIRLVMAAALTALTAAFPAGAASFGEAAPWFTALSAIGLVTSFTSTLMFTALGSFFNRISDPEMGGAYLTLLNTIANMGIILPKTPVFAAMDALTVATCSGGDGVALPLSCPKKTKDMAGSNACTDAGWCPLWWDCVGAGGVCSLDTDGFYVISYTMVLVGAFLGVWYARLFPALTRLPLQRWRARPRGGAARAKA